VGAKPTYTQATTTIQSTKFEASKRSKKGTKKLVHTRLFIMNLLSLLLLIPSFALATDIKWTAGEGPKPAPYSKRYRDAMGIEEPSYAKSDAEAMMDGLAGTGPLSLMISLFLGLAVAGTMYYYFFRSSAGQQPLFSKRPNASAAVKATESDVTGAREARLKRFTGEGPKKYSEIMAEAGLQLKVDKKKKRKQTLPSKDGSSSSNIGIHSLDPKDSAGGGSNTYFGGDSTLYEGKKDDGESNMHNSSDELS